MNRLARETSPYLLQHADNPVDWFPWGEEALAKARAEDKPILISVGYSTCHWCHVMERESFRDDEIAAFMNEFFVNIKIDREERPDLDQLYMEAGFLLNRTQGWPLHCFLTPQGKPFYAGGYFPPEPGAKQMAWFQALQYALYNFRENRGGVERQAERTVQSLHNQHRETPATQRAIGDAFEKLRQSFDLQEGGFGEATKFPDLLPLRYLLHYHYFTHDAEALSHLLFSLDRIFRGGIYDPVGGGIFRYAVDRHWRVPHFEKMLNDNALLAHLLADVYAHTGDEHWKEHLEKTLHFLRRELASDDGGFYSGLDAETEGVEGKFYAWTEEELEAALQPGLLPRARAIFGDDPVLHQPLTLEELATQHGESRQLWEEAYRQIISQMAKARAGRPKPRRDAKILLGWNALTASAFARAGEATQNPVWKGEALRLVQFLLDTFYNDNNLLRVYAQGRVYGTALLSDYAYLAQALLDVYRTSWNAQWLEKSLEIAAAALDRFGDDDGALFFTNPTGEEDLIVRIKETHDLELPSGNSVFQRVLQDLGLLFSRSDLQERAARMLLSAQGAMAENPAAHALWLCQSLAETQGVNETAIIGPGAHSLATQIGAQFIPNTVLLASETGQEDFPLFEARPPGAHAAIYVCRDQACLRPVHTIQEFNALTNVMI